MTVLKHKRTKRATITTKFTRAEFQLLESLLEAEGNTPLAQTNSNYSAIIGDLQSRCRSVGSPDAEHWPTDAVLVR